MKEHGRNAIRRIAPQNAEEVQEIVVPARPDRSINDWECHPHVQFALRVLNHCTTSAIPCCKVVLGKNPRARARVTSATSESGSPARRSPVNENIAALPHSERTRSAISRTE